jgi:hypothetical protein
MAADRFLADLDHPLLEATAKYRGKCRAMPLMA